MFGFIPLLVLAAVVVAVVLTVRRSGDVTRPPGGSAPVRRLFQYGMLLAALIVAAEGLANLTGIALRGSAASSRGSDLATPLALTVVGLPVFWLLGRWAWRAVNGDEAEREGRAWTLYLNLVLMGSLGVMIGTGFSVADWLVGGGRYQPSEIGHLLVWSAVWGLHWIAWRVVDRSGRPAFHLWAGATAGLAVLVVSGAALVAILVDRAVGGEVAARSGVAEDIRMSVAGMVIGGSVWAWYWLRNGLHAVRTTGWYAYVMVPGVLGGFIAAISGAGTVLYLVLQWWFGDPGTESATRHFADMGAGIGALAAGIGVWSYHRAVVRFDTTGGRREVDRFYDYTVAGAALVTVAVAVTILIVALFEVLTPEVASRGGSSDSNIVVAAVTLLVVGVPTWAVAWRRIVRSTAEDIEVETSSQARRTYLFGLFGLGGAVAFGALIFLLIELFKAATDGFTWEQLSRDVRVPIALLVTTGVLAGYHWVIFRSERHIAERRVRRNVLLVCAGRPEIDQIEERAHARLKVLHRLDLVDEAAFDIDDVVAAINEAEGDRVLVLAGSDGVRTIPYR